MSGLTLVPHVNEVEKKGAFSLLDHRLQKSWRSLGENAADLVFEFANIKKELVLTGDTELIGTGFKIYQF